MKRTLLLSTVAVLSAAFIFTSCSPAGFTQQKKKRNTAILHRPPPPRYYNSVSLIITPTPGFIMNQNPDGRYYHRNPQGYTVLERI